MTTAAGDPSRRSRAAMALIAVAVPALYFCSVYYEVWRHATRDEARPADAIVVLGAAEYNGRPSPVLKARLDHALDLYYRKFAPRIITTGGHGEGSPFSEGEVSRAYLSQHGVPAEFITVEAEGQTTAQSLVAVVEIMDRMQLSSCIVVSDGYHIHRIKRMLEEHGVTVHGSPRAAGALGSWEQSKRYARESLSYILWRLGIRV